VATSSHFDEPRAGEPKTEFELGSDVRTESEAEATLEVRKG